MTSNRVWVPSLQKYIRIEEFSCEQYREILKSINDDYEFDYSLNKILQENIIDKNFYLDKATILDKFIIVLQQKVHSCGEILKLIRVCDNCGDKTDFEINLNNLLDTLSKNFDRSFETSFKTDDLELVCDMPLVDIKQETIVDPTDFKKRVDSYLFSFIKSVRMNNSCFDFKDCSFSEKIHFCENLPYQLILQMKNEFLAPIHSLFKDLLLVKNKCKNKMCGDELELKMDINNITDLIRILFKDSSLTNILSQYTNVTMNCHFDYNFFKNISPGELNIVTNLLESGANQDKQEQMSKDIDLFQEYRLQTEGMVESPSEFM